LVDPWRGPFCFAILSASFTMITKRVGSAPPGALLFCAALKNRIISRRHNMKGDRRRAARQAAWRTTMGMELSLGDILKDVRAASENIDAHNTATAQRITAVEKSVDELFLKANRPGGFGGGDRDSDLERKDAAALCRIKHDLATPK